MALNLENHTYRSSIMVQLAKDSIFFFKKTPKVAFPPGEMFLGAGVYALYYNGGFQEYSAISGREIPIYVGKAVPYGARTGREPRVDQPRLRNRLRLHANSVDAAQNLDIHDFQCRFMLMPPELSPIIGAVESLLIGEFRPLWNTSIEGFGNKPLGGGRESLSRKSSWDRLHPGRSGVGVIE